MEKKYPEVNLERRKQMENRQEIGKLTGRLFSTHQAEASWRRQLLNTGRWEVVPDIIQDW